MRMDFGSKRPNSTYNYIPRILRWTEKFLYWKMVKFSPSTRMIRSYLERHSLQPTCLRLLIWALLCDDGGDDTGIGKGDGRDDGTRSDDGEVGPCIGTGCGDEWVLNRDFFTDGNGYRPPATSSLKFQDRHSKDKAKRCPIDASSLDER